MNTIVKISSQVKLFYSEGSKAGSLRRFVQCISVVLFIVLFALNSSAQTLQEYGVLVAGMNASSDPNVRAEAAHLDSLVFQVHSKMYLKNSVQNFSGQTAPVCLQTDDESIGMLSVTDPLFHTVELITVKINSPGDLNFVLNLANLPGFEQLKYVQFRCSYPCDPEVLSPLFTGNNPGITVFYLISIPN